MVNMAKSYIHEIPEGYEARIEGNKVIIELAESEDERIRKIIIKHFEEIANRNEQSWINLDIPYILAYLEKQKYDRMKPIYDAKESFESALEKAWKSYNDSGARTVDGCEDDYVECAHAKGFREGFLYGLEKQKENPKSADSIPSDCMSDAKCEDRWHKVGDSLPDNPREVLCKDEAGNYFIGRYYVGEGWEISNYDDEDKPHHLNPPVSKWIDFPPEKQKGQDWNKKPCLTCQEYEKGHKQGYTEGCTAGYNKAMKEVEQKEQNLTMANSPQLKEQKPAWSEEDESELTAVIYCVSRAIKASKDENERNSLLNAKKWLQDKLSFLVKSLRPSWKPSEEQMNLLLNIEGILRERLLYVKATQLAELYEQLKSIQ